jgi:hypothetical protein
MPRGKGIYDDEKVVAPKEPTDQGRDDTTDQENTPDVSETDQEPTG